jgi:hypothetical protein
MARTALPPPEQQAQQQQHELARQLPHDSAEQLPEQVHVIGCTARCQVMSDGSLWWRMPAGSGRAPLPSTAVELLKLPLSTAAIFILPDGTMLPCTLKRRSDGRASLPGWSAVAAALRLKKGSVLRLQPEQRRQQQDELRLHLSCLRRGTSASAAATAGSEAQAVQPPAADVTITCANASP